MTREGSGKFSGVIGPLATPKYYKSFEAWQLWPGSVPLAFEESAEGNNCTVPQRMSTSLSMRPGLCSWQAWANVLPQFAGASWSMRCGMGDGLQRHQMRSEAVGNTIWHKASNQLHVMPNQWTQLVVQPLSRYAGRGDNRTFLVVIDALNECGEEGSIGILLRLLPQVCDCGNIRVRILVTSRPETPIRNGFDQMETATYQGFVLHRMPTEMSDRDIQLYLQHYLSKIATERRLESSWPGERLVSAEMPKTNRATDTKRTLITAVECISADGRSLPPLIIFPGVDLRSNWVCHEAPDWQFTCSKKGYMNSEINLEWMQKVFEPSTKERANGRPRILISDGFETHESLDVLKFCLENNIIPCRLPSHTSHKLQPCDVSVFGPLKTAYREQVEHLERRGANTVNKEHFVLLYRRARDASVSVQPKPRARRDVSANRRTRCAAAPSWCPTDAETSIQPSDSDDTHHNRGCI